MRFHQHIVVLEAPKIISIPITIPAPHQVLGTPTAGILAVALGRLLYVVRVHLVILEFVSQYGDVSHISVHALHQALVLVHEPPDSMPRIGGAGQVAEGLLAQVAGNRRQHLGATPA